MDIAEIIATRRAQQGLSVRALAHMVGIDHEQLRRIEAGQQPRLDLAARLLDALDVDAGTRLRLLGGGG